MSGGEHKHVNVLSACKVYETGRNGGRKEIFFPFFLSASGMEAMLQIVQ